MRLEAQPVSHAALGAETGRSVGTSNMKALRTLLAAAERQRDRLERERDTWKTKCAEQEEELVVLQARLKFIKGRKVNHVIKAAAVQGSAEWLCLQGLYASRPAGGTRVGLSARPEGTCAHLTSSKPATRSCMCKSGLYVCT